ncbi:hypothetical protein FQN54_007755 [Arachnomyces sp. PD_36]|nr:hypothetical protein FQN54_007755 [Arachnomyces sp. PD_36]
MLTRMLLDNLATELLLHIFHSCTSISDVLNLALTCRRFHRIFTSSQKLPILLNAADAEYGPLQDIIQLVTQNASQPAHVIREAPLSAALLEQVVGIGRVAKKWEDIYPIKKWKVNFEDRRLLTDHERFSLRRAVYRLWLYDRTFHSRIFPRTTRLMKHVVVERAELLHNWSTDELAEIEDLRIVVRDVVRSHICPSNGTILRKFQKRYPENTQTLSFNVHLNYPPPSSYSLQSSRPNPSSSPLVDENPFAVKPRTVKPQYNKGPNKLNANIYSDPSNEGWGDELPHYYIVEDMMKLDPGQVLWLRENAESKEDVELYVRGLGDWFENNGETFGQTLEWVMSERGDDVEVLRDAIADAEIGIVTEGRC